MALSLYVRSSVSFAIEGDCIIITGPLGSSVAMSPTVLEEGVRKAQVCLAMWHHQKGANVVAMPARPDVAATH